MTQIYSFIYFQQTKSIVKTSIICFLQMAQNPFQILENIYKTVLQGLKDIF